MTQSIADMHRESLWTGRCLACNDSSPCLERRYANAMLIHSGRRARHRRPAAALTVVIGVSLEIPLIAADLVGLLWRSPRFTSAED